jgi:hypothetical protein
MKAKKYKNVNEVPKILKEPAIHYGSVEKLMTDNYKRITMSSLKEQEELNYIYWLSLSPEERWAEHFKLLQTIYGRNKNNKKTGYRIIFEE